MASAKDDDTDEEDAVYDNEHSGNVILGIINGELDPWYITDVTTSRAGGPPVWCGGVAPKAVRDQEGPLACELCGNPLWLVAQVYAPADRKRVLHIFGCNERHCSVRNGKTFICQIYRASVL